MMQPSVIPTQINHQSASANNPMASASSAYTPSCSSPGWNTVEGNKRRKSGKSGKSVQQEPQPLSICIPRAHKTITLQRVRNTFQRLNLGSLDSVDIVSKTSKEGEPFVTIYVHFSNWNYDNPEAVAFREKIIKGEQVSIFYDEPKPWFWKCALNHLPRKLPSIAPVTAAPLSPPRPMSPPHLPRWGTAEYMSLFSIVDTINTKK
jgi:hypothetical protein